MTDLDNTRSMPTRPDLDKLRAGVGAHQAAAYIEYLESLPCQHLTPGEWAFVKRLLGLAAVGHVDIPVRAGLAAEARALLSKFT